MEIVSLGHDFQHGTDFSLERKAGLPTYLLLIVRSPFRFRLRGTELRTAPHSIILIDKNTPHDLYADGEVYINDWVAFDAVGTEDALYRDEKPLFNTFVSGEEVAFFSDVIRLMQRERNSTDASKQTHLSYFLKILLGKWRAFSERNTFDRRYFGILQALREEIRTHPERKYSVRSLADRVPLSSSYFQTLYQQYFHISPIADVINSRIEYAAQLLCSTDYSVSAIAERLGYASDLQFFKQFKSVMNTTPRAYRMGHGRADRKS